jgi:hypothetical protein
MNYLVGFNDLVKDQVHINVLGDLLTRLFINRPKLNKNEHNIDSTFQKHYATIKTFMAE